MSLAIAFILLQGSSEIPLPRLQDDLKSRWPTSAVTEPLLKEGIASLKVDGVNNFVAPMPVALPWSDLEGPCSTTMFWKDAATEVKSHTHHVLVTATGEVDPVSLRMSLTKVVASTLATLPNAIGVYWAEAGSVFKKADFIELAQIDPLEPPVALWVRVQVGRGDDGLSQAYTQGLKALGHLELETTTSPDSPLDLMERLIALSNYLIKAGPVIKDGETVGASARERIAVRIGPSKLGGPGDVMHLEWAPPGAKPWWRFWD